MLNIAYIDFLFRLNNLIIFSGATSPTSGGGIPGLLGQGNLGGLASLLGQGQGSGMMNSPGMQSLMQQMAENPTLMSQVKIISLMTQNRVLDLCQ